MKFSLLDIKIKSRIFRTPYVKSIMLYNGLTSYLSKARVE